MNLRDEQNGKHNFQPNFHTQNLQISELGEIIFVFADRRCFSSRSVFHFQLERCAQPESLRMQTCTRRRNGKSVNFTILPNRGFNQFTSDTRSS